MIAHDLSDVRGLQVGVICNEWYVKILRQEAIIPQNADFGSDDQIWNSGVKGRGPKSSRRDLIACEYVRDANARVGEQVALGFLTICAVFEPQLRSNELVTQPLLLTGLL